MLSAPAPADSTQPLHLYVHWPFCRSKCPYCDFNSHVRDGIDEQRWCRAYLAELGRGAGETAGRTVESVFFGGGTPSLMDPRTAAAVLDGIAARWPLAADLEVTLEANPSTAERQRFRDFRAAGVNRLSIGVQSLDDRDLRALGRGHSAADARSAVALAAAVFPRFSFDLIWGRPGQQPDAWERELEDAVAMAGEHLSAYQLTIEAGTGFFRDGVEEADEDRALALYEITHRVLGAAGLPAYEISNHARPGGACRHNLAVWNGADYLGIGPGAHGRLTAGGRTSATRAIRAPEKWLASVEERGGGDAERVALDARQRRDELVLQGLRLTTGIDRQRFRAATGVEPEAAVDADALALLTDAGCIETDRGGLRATAEGRLRLNALLALLLA